MLSALLALAGQDLQPVDVPVAPPRFELAAPLPGLPWTEIDTRMANEGIAHQTAKAHGLQGRVLWIESSANIARLRDDQEIRELVRRIAETGFNTICIDVKPIVGRTIYPSEHADQLISWRDEALEPGFDPMIPLQEAAEEHGLSLLVAMNAFSEGHSWSRRYADDPDSSFGEPGWGYENPDLQTVQYEALPVLRRGEYEADVHPQLNPDSWDEPIALFTSKTPSTQPGDIVRVINKQGRLLPLGTPIPENGAKLVGRGPKAERLLAGRGTRLATRAEFAPIQENQTQIPLMMNPHHPEMQERALTFVREVATKYDIDGFLYDDRLRYGGLNADFSELARDKFENYVGQELTWPTDVYEVTIDARMNRGIRPGPYFQAWLVWRAMEMRNFVRRVGATFKEIKPEAIFGVYVGSWYGDYARYGVNYGWSELVTGIPFLDRYYRRTGFADDVDLVITGCYYSVPTVYQAMVENAPTGRTVEAAGVLSNRVVKDAAWTYGGIMLMDYYDNPEALKGALQAAAATTQGVMVFDLSHRIDEVLPILATAFSQEKTAPHTRPDLLAEVRERREAFVKNGGVLPPVPFYEGAPNAGF
jgi:hypothetical protein